jgi:hypothetical protein
VTRIVADSTARRPRLVDAAIAAVLFAVALAVRLPFILRVGPAEGGGDEWYSAWRSWAVLIEHGVPGNYLHPALYYDLGAALFGGLGIWGRLTGQYGDRTDLLAAFVRDDVGFLQALELLSAVCGALTIVVTFLLGRRLFGRVAGFVAGAIVTFLPLHLLYSQAARVDALFVLGVAVFGYALAGVATSGCLRDSLWAGIALGLTVGANYPGLLLVVPYVWIHARRPDRSALRRAGAGLAAAAVAFLVVNPAALTEPQNVLAGFRFQSSMAFHAHPFREGYAPSYVWNVLVQQGWVFCAMAFAAVVWFAVRGPVVARVLAVTAAGYLAVFALLSTHFDRYVLPPLPWLAVLIGGLMLDLHARIRRPIMTGAGATLLVLAFVAQGAHASRERILVARPGAREDPRRDLQTWLLANARTGATVWIEGDVWPLLQATFADSGGTLQKEMQKGFLRAYPEFKSTVLKGERVERGANFSPSLVTDGVIQYALTCRGFVDYARASGAANQTAFYTALDRACRVVRSDVEGCWIAECPRRGG